MDSQNNHGMADQNKPQWQFELNFRNEQDKDKLLREKIEQRDYYLKLLGTECQQVKYLNYIIENICQKSKKHRKR